MTLALTAFNLLRSCDSSGLHVTHLDEGRYYKAVGFAAMPEQKELT